MRVRKPTEMFRATVSQEIRVILGPEKGAGSPYAYRRVHLIVPPSPQISAGLDVTPDEEGLNRSYKLSDMPSGSPIVFTLLPEQSLVASAVTNFVEASLIVEYLEGHP